MRGLLLSTVASAVLAFGGRRCRPPRLRPTRSASGLATTRTVLPSTTIQGTACIATTTSTAARINRSDAVRPPVRVNAERKIGGVTVTPPISFWEAGCLVAGGKVVAGTNRDHLSNPPFGCEPSYNRI